MRRIFIPTLILVLFSLGQAQAHGDNQVSIDKATDDVLKSQGISEVEKIDCKKVTDEQFEQLGESFMDMMHPDSREHDLMDKMMGGEGSASLRTAHITMGQRYLNCGGQETGMMGWSNKISASPTNSWRNYLMMGGISPMMGWFGWGFGYAIMILFWILVVAAIVVLVKWLINQGREK